MGAVIGLVAAGALYGVFLAATAAATAGVAGFAGFAGTIGPLVGGAAGFNPAVLMAFNGVISSAVGLFTGGSQAVAAYEQRKFQIGTVETVRALDSRTRALEQVVQPSRQVQKILENGPRHAVNFQTTETERAAEVKAAAPTIH